MGLKHLISKKNIILAFAVILLPALLLADGDITKSDGVFALIAFFILVYAIHKQKEFPNKLEMVPINPPVGKNAATLDILKILAGGTIIFVACRYLVEQSVYFATFSISLAQLSASLFFQSARTFPNLSLPPVP